MVTNSLVTRFNLSQGWYSSLYSSNYGGDMLKIFVVNKYFNRMLVFLEENSTMVVSHLSFYMYDNKIRAVFHVHDNFLPHQYVFDREESDDQEDEDSGSSIGYDDRSNYTKVLRKFYSSLYSYRLSDFVSGKPLAKKGRSKIKRPVTSLFFPTRFNFGPRLGRNFRMSFFFLKLFSSSTYTWAVSQLFRKLKSLG
jgi:hypothetical protein